MNETVDRLERELVEAKTTINAILDERDHWRSRALALEAHNAQRIASAAIAITPAGEEKAPPRRRFSYGALPLSGREWMIGRTVADIDAVIREAEATGKSPDEVATTKWPHLTVSDHMAPSSHRAMT